MAFELRWAPAARLDLKDQEHLIEIVRVWHAARGIPQL